MFRLNTANSTVFVKIVNPSDVASPLKIELQGTRQVASQAAVVTLSAAPNDTNSLQNPNQIVPVNSSVNGISASFEYTFAAHSITVIKLKVQ